MLYSRVNIWHDRRSNLLMKVRIVTTSGNTIYGSLLGEEAVSLPPKEAIQWIMNSDTKFIRYLQPNGQEVLFNKNAIMNIAEDDYGQEN
jgi:hypothetical protein